MKLIKDFEHREMKHIEYDYSDAENLKKRFSKINPKLIDDLCLVLKEKDEKINAIDCYDGQSGWQGTNFKIGNADLSMNGYCLTEASIKLFIDGGQNKMWYNFYDKEYKEILNKEV